MTNAQLNQYLELIARLIEEIAGDGITAATIVRLSKISA